MRGNKNLAREEVLGHDDDECSRVWGCGCGWQVIKGRGLRCKSKQIHRSPKRNWRVTAHRHKVHLNKHSCCFLVLVSVPPLAERVVLDKLGQVCGWRRGEDRREDVACGHHADELAVLGLHHIDPVHAVVHKHGQDVAQCVLGVAHDSLHVVVVQPGLQVLLHGGDEGWALDDGADVAGRDVADDLVLAVEHRHGADLVVVQDLEGLPDGLGGAHSIRLAGHAEAERKHRLALDTLDLQPAVVVQPADDGAARHNVGDLVVLDDKDAVHLEEGQQEADVEHRVCGGIYGQVVAKAAQRQQVLDVRALKEGFLLGSKVLCVGRHRGGRQLLAHKHRCGPLVQHADEPLVPGHALWHLAVDDGRGRDVALLQRRDGEAERRVGVEHNNLALLVLQLRDLRVGEEGADRHGGAAS
eukprot:m.116596 g.116596  ORF g.116596 m.116596 type:complete len:412 (+) comp16081_c1_seq3:1663-2898(+)